MASSARAKDRAQHRVTDVDILLTIVRDIEVSGRQATVPEIREGFATLRRREPKNLHATVDNMIKANLLLRQGSVLVLGDRGLKRVGPQESAGAVEKEWSTAVAEVSASLSELVDKIPNADERGYISEAISCLAAKAPRAAVVMGWTGSIDHLRNKVEAAGFAQFEAAYRAIYPKSKRGAPRALEDLEDFSDREMLTVTERMRIVAPAGKKALLAQLDLRNSCGHPTAAKPRVNTVKAFFEQVIDFIYL